MSTLKTLLMTLALIPWPSFAADQPLSYVFASCTGRFSAELEHAWLMGDARSDEIEQRRAHFAALVDATTPKALSARAMNWRIQAKFAHASLLKQVTFSQDSDRANWALARAQSEIAHCTSFLLES